MKQEDLNEILGILGTVEEDSDVPKNIRCKIKVAMDILNDNQKHIGLRVDTSLEHLGDLVEDPNLPQFNRMQIWSVVSQLESH